MIYVGPLSPCPPAAADLVGLKEGTRVAHLTADTVTELYRAARDLGLDPCREQGKRTVRWRLVVNTAERNRAVHHLNAREISAADLFALQSGHARREA